MKPTRHIFAISLLLFLGGAACAPTEEEEAPAPEETEEDELIFRKGSVDHAAIVEVTTMMLAGKPTSSLLDPYNQEDPFAIGSAKYEPTLSERLAKFDGYDGVRDWTAQQARAWATRVASGDYLVVDTSKPCDFRDPHTYLEIERARMTGREHATCGGRMPNEDALDVTLNFLIRGPAASENDEGALRDGVEQATKPAVDTFPYLAEMN